MKLKITKYLKLGCLIISLLFIVLFFLIYLFLSDTKKNTEEFTKTKIDNVAIEKNKLEDVSGMQVICKNSEDLKQIQLWRFQENGKYLFSFITRYIANSKLNYFTLNKIDGKEWMESKKGFEYELIRDEQLGSLLEVKVGKKIRFDFTDNNTITLFTPKLNDKGVNIWNCKDFNNYDDFYQNIEKLIQELNKTID